MKTLNCVTVNWVRIHSSQILKKCPSASVLRSNQRGSPASWGLFYLSPMWHSSFSIGQHSTVQHYVKGKALLYIPANTYWTVPEINYDKPLPVSSFRKIIYQTEKESSFFLHARWVQRTGDIFQYFCCTLIMDNFNCKSVRGKLGSMFQSRIPLHSLEEMRRLKHLWLDCRKFCF